jgi:hypothetical protein
MGGSDHSCVDKGCKPVRFPARHPDPPLLYDNFTGTFWPLPVLFTSSDSSLRGSRNQKRLFYVVDACTGDPAGDVKRLSLALYNQSSTRGAVLCLCPLSCLRAALRAGSEVGVDDEVVREEAG